MANILKTMPFYLVMLFCMAPAFAQQEPIDTTKLAEPPSFVNELSEEKFLEQSKVFKEEPYGDKYLAYKVRLPKTWYKKKTSADFDIDPAIKSEGEEESLGFDQRVLGEIALYFGPTRLDALSRFVVNAQSLEHEVTAKNWFLHEILARGYALEGLKVYSDRRVEALYVVVERDTAYVVRAVAEINGPRMVVASYYVPDNHWKEERAQQEYAIKSFEFLSPEQTKIEATRSYSFLDLLTFEYPVSWRLVAPNIYSIDGMEAKLISSVDSKTLNGEISITIVSNEYENVIAEEIGYIQEDMESRNLLVRELMEVLPEDKYEFGPHVLYSHIEVYRAINKKDQVVEHEFWLAVMEEDRYYYVITMLTPSRSSEYYAWANNTETFETVIESIKP